ISSTIAAYTDGSAVGSPCSSRAWTCATAAPRACASATATPISTGLSGTAGWLARDVSGPVGATVITTGPAPASRSVMYERDRLDLDEQLWVQKPRDFDQCAGGIRLGQIPLTHRRDLWIQLGVGHIVVDLHNVREPGARRLQRDPQVVHHLLGLGGDVAD